MQIVFTPSVKLSGYSAKHDFSAVFTQLIRTIGEVTTYSVDQDINAKIVTPATAYSDYRVDLTGTPESTQFKLESLTPALASIEAPNKVKYVSAGTAKIRVTCLFGTREFNLTMASMGSPVVKSTVSHIAGSLGANVEANIATMMSGISVPGPSTQNLYNSAVRGVSAETCSGTKNQSSILRNFDMSFLSFSQASGAHYPCMLISQRHALVNTHVAGSWYVFRRQDGTFVRATVKSYVDYGDDLRLLYFNETINGCAFMPIIDGTFQVKTPTLVKQVVNGSITENYRSLIGILISANPSTYLAEEQHAQLIEVTSHSWSVAVQDQLKGVSIIAVQSENPYSLFSSTPYPGDSGSPVLLPITYGGSTRLCYLCSLYTAGGGPSGVFRAAWINSNMSALATAAGDMSAYSAQLADLSAFTSF